MPVRPLGRLIGFVRSWAEFISDFGVGETHTVFRLPEASFGTVICYEVIFPELFRDFVTRGADFTPSRVCNGSRRTRPHDDAIEPQVQMTFSLFLLQ